MTTQMPSPQAIPRRRPRALGLLALIGALALALAGCGSSSSSSSSSASASSTAATSTPSTASTPAAVTPAPGLAHAEHPTAGRFPAAAGRTLQQIATLTRAQAQFGAATGVFTPGTRRVAFGLNTSSGAFIYAPTAIYIATSPNTPAKGPFLAPADPMIVAPQYRSRQNSGPGGIQAIYAARVPIPHPGTYTVLALTRAGNVFVGSPGQIAVAASSPIPDVGQRPPAIATDTAASVGGNTALLTTRIPPEDMHAVSFKDVLGKRPIALLFSTPQLCVSKVCGPVTDIAVALQHQYGGRVAFIHQEVYVDNQPSQGLRPQLKAFHLQTEPWLFVVNRQGVIIARLEGAFGLTEMGNALQAALR
jgi:hypothetical protein